MYHLLMPKLKKLFLTLFTFVILSFSFVPYAKAADTGSWYNQSFKEWYVKVYDENTSNPSEIFGERYTAAQVQWVFYSIFSLIISGGNTEVSKIIACAQTGEVTTCGSAIFNYFKKYNTSMNNTDSLYVFTARPISGIGYLTNLGTKFHIIPEAKAQTGFGFTAANPAQTIWKMIRDVSYALLVLVIIVMAFMIMFRVKISPQVVISIQSALPKIVLALILITFSYAIAGFLIDIMYVVVGLLTAIFTSNSTLTEYNWQTLFRQATTVNIFELLGKYGLLFILFAGMQKVQGAGFVDVLVFIFSFIAIFILLWYSFKTLILVLKTYALIMLSIMFAPLQILLGTVTQGAGIGSWLKNMFSYLAVYPVIYVLSFLAYFFLIQGLPEDVVTLFDKNVGLLTPFGIKANALGGIPWMAPFSDTTGFIGNSRLLWMIVSFAIIVLIPKTTEIIQSFITKRPFDYGSAIGESVGYAQGAAGKGWQLSKGAMGAWSSKQEKSDMAFANAKGQPYISNSFIRFLKSVGWVKS